MTFEEYQQAAQKTAIHPEKYKIIYPALGLGNEAGEVQGKIKKWLRGDDGDGEMTPERKEVLKGEIGDVLWYLSSLSSDLGLSLEDIATYNIQKLRSRQERNVLQGDGDNR